jgi:hypothetical protein
VAVSGSVTSSSSSSALQAGKVYYSNTKGKLVASPVFAGQEHSLFSSSSSSGNVYYLYDSLENAFVTLESRIGLATASNTLFVQTNNQQ